MKITIRCKHEPAKFYSRAGLKFTKTAREYEVTEAQLAVLQADVHLLVGEVREVLDQSQDQAQAQEQEPSQEQELNQQSNSAPKSQKGKK